MSDTSMSNKEALGRVLFIIGIVALMFGIALGLVTSVTGIYNNMVEIPDYEYSSLYRDIEEHNSKALNVVVQDALADYEITIAEHNRIENIIGRLESSKLKNQIAKEIQ